MAASFLSWLKYRLRFKNGVRRTRGRSRIVPELLELEDRCLPAWSGYIQGIQIPSQLLNTSSDLAAWKANQVLYAFSPAGTQDPSYNQKTVTITNNSTKVVYPFFYDANSGQSPKGHDFPGMGSYDPYDPYNQGYRGYIGYTGSEGKEYFGLLPGQTITVPVPLVFWDSGRLYIATDSADFLGNGPLQGNPYLFAFNNTQAPVIASISPGSNVLTFPTIWNSPSWQTNQVNPTPVTPAWLTQILKQGQTVTLEASSPGGVGGATLSPGQNPGQLIMSKNALDTFTNQQFTLVFKTPQPTFTYIASGLPLESGNISSTKGLVMWYHSLKADTPQAVSQDQLTEWTFRGDYLKTLPTAQTTNSNPAYNNILDPNLGVFVNSAGYDVSYVDAMMLPVAMEVTDALVGFNNNNNGKGEPYGWAGSLLSIPAMQSAIKAFESANSPDLGTYFDVPGTPFASTNPGWPREFDPTPTNDINLPSGQNIFLQSSYISSGRSIQSSPFPVLYPNKSGALQNLGFNYFNLTSATIPTTPAVPEPSSLAAGGCITTSDGPSSLVFTAADPDYANLKLLQANVKAGLVFYATSTGTDMPAGTKYKVTGVTFDSGTGQATVTFDHNTVGSNHLNTYTFTRQITDYAATAIMNLWYAWAYYYANDGYKAFNLNAQAVPGQDGTIANGNILTLNDPSKVSNLVPGMLVTGGTLPTGATILAIDSANNKITLSATSANGTFSFAMPNIANILGNGDPQVQYLVDDIKATFGTSNTTANQFSQTLYDVMSAFGTSLLNPNPINGPLSIQLMQNIIGCNTGFLKQSNLAIDVLLTNAIISLLRGVPDFTKAPWQSPSTWYPNPAAPASDQNSGGNAVTFNAYNLDPFVWFVHVKLGLSGYGFSVDDGISFIGSNTSTKANVQVSIGGPGGLPQRAPWNNLTQFGPVSLPGTVVSSGGANVLEFTGLNAQKAASLLFSPKPGEPGALVTGPGFPAGVTIGILSIDPSGSPVRIPLVGYTPTLGQSATYTFFSPVVVRATVATTTTDVITISLTEPGPVPDQGAVALTKILAGLLMPNAAGVPANLIQVTGPGIPTGTTVTVTSFKEDTTKGIVTIKLSQPLVLGKQKPGAYAFTFGFQPPI